MSTLVKRILPGTLLSGILLLSAGAWAMGHGMHRDPDRMLEHIAEELELSETQEGQIQTLFNEASDARASDGQRMAQIREELKAMRGDFDAGRAQTLADELGVITSRTVYTMANTYAEIYQLLTPEQRAEMDEMVERREERMEKRRSKYHR